MRRAARIGLGALALLAIGGALAAVVYRPDRAIQAGVSVIAHQVCAKTFVSKLDPQQAFAEYSERAGIRLLRGVLGYSVDRAQKSVTTSAAGLFTARAAFREGLGCNILHDGTTLYQPRVDIEALREPLKPPLLDSIAGPALVEPAEPALRTALDHAFAEPDAPPYRRTKAVVIVRDGKVVAERYAPGVGIATQLPSFSLTKSFINAMIGILTQQGLVTPSLPAAVPEWRGASDPRREIEVEHLMRMTSGLDLPERNNGFDATSIMLTLEDDMAGFAAKAPLIAPPGTRWAYSSATTQILARIVRDAAGGSEQSLKLAWRELFNPLGMRDVTLELDAVGTIQGSANMLASARDWARFGLLYLNDGVVGGQRLLHEDWVDFSAAATLDTDYGAGFWTNRSEHGNAKGRAALGIPRDAFFGFGDMGQRIAILPTQRMVIVRMGDSVDPTGDIRGFARLVKEAIAAVGE